MKKNHLNPVTLMVAGLALAGCIPEDDNGSGGGVVGTEIGEVEPNDNFPGTSSVVGAVPSTLTGNVVCSYRVCDDDIDVFAFVPSETREYTMVLKDIGSNDLDLGMYVDDGSYTYYWAMPDAPSDGPTETLKMTLDAGVTYYVEIEAWDTGDSGEDYLVTIE